MTKVLQLQTYKASALDSLKNSFSPANEAGAVSQRWIGELYLKNFRNHENLSLSVPNGAPVVLVGANGAGKTSLLEGLSLLAPGRGLRQAGAYKIIYNRATEPLTGLFAKINSSGESTDCTDKVSLVYKQAREEGEGVARFSKKVKINNRNASALALGEHLSLLWLTPAMTRFFCEGSQRAERRKFMDRLVMAVEKQHSRHLANFERLKKQRQVLLEKNNSQTEWLETLEQQMAHLAVQIDETRAFVITQLNEALGELAPENFPCAKVSTSASLEEVGLSSQQKVNVLCERFAQNRARDRAAGRTHCGPHQSDFYLFNETQNQPAQECSSGEVKALLITLVLAAAELIARLEGRTPLVLFDEITAHLDERRLFVLLKKVSTLPAQLWMTGTDPKVFAPLKMDAHFFLVQPSQAKPL